MSEGYAEPNGTATPQGLETADKQELDTPSHFRESAYLTVKRVLDIVGALSLLVLLSPVLLAAAIGIKLHDVGPVIFWQERIGRGTTRFRVAKFRTMVIDAERRWHDIPAGQKRTDGAIKIDVDPRITWFGQFLRRLSIDELPQLWNVLRGEMSLVGPRPFVPGETDAYPEAKKIRHSVPPGLTGLAQIRGRSDIEVPEILEHDMEYVRSRSLQLDLIIACRTPFVILRGKGAK